MQNILHFLLQWCEGGICKFRNNEKDDSENKPFKSSIDGQWSKWSSLSKCSCQSGLQGIRIATRKCDNPPPKNGGHFCVGTDKRYITCGQNDCTGNVATGNDLSSAVEDICQKASLADPNILPFGDAQNTSSCHVHCFKVRHSLKSKYVSM